MCCLGGRPFADVNDSSFGAFKTSMKHFLTHQRLPYSCLIKSKKRLRHAKAIRLRQPKFQLVSAASVAQNTRVVITKISSSQGKCNKQNRNHTVRDFFHLFFFIYFPTKVVWDHVQSSTCRIYMYEFFLRLMHPPANFTYFKNVLRSLSRVKK